MCLGPSGCVFETESDFLNYFYFKCLGDFRYQTILFTVLNLHHSLSCEKCVLSTNKEIPHSEKAADG